MEQFATISRNARPEGETQLRMDHRFEPEKSLGEATVDDNRRRELDKTASDSESYRQLYVDMLKRLNLPLARLEPSWRSAPAATPKETTAPSFPGDKRNNTRYKCEGTVEFRTHGSEVRTFARVTDISFGGCYVEMTATSAPGTKLNLLIEANGIRFQVKGTVRVTYPCLGMGIAFTDTSREDRASLSELLLILSGQRRGAVQQPASSDDEDPRSDMALFGNLDASSVLNAVTKVFENKTVLSRDEFFRLIHHHDATRRS